MEEFREAMRKDPTRPVAQTYKAQMTWMTTSLDGQDREDFIAHRPIMRAMDKSMYRFCQTKNPIGFKGA